MIIPDPTCQNFFIKFEKLLGGYDLINWKY